MTYEKRVPEPEVKVNVEKKIHMFNNDDIKTNGTNFCFFFILFRLAFFVIKIFHILL